MRDNTEQLAEAVAECIEAFVGRYCRPGMDETHQVVISPVRTASYEGKQLATGLAVLVPNDRYDAGMALDIETCEREGWPFTLLRGAIAGGSQDHQ